jgi:LPXTG-site transpeptidase (sortase) family protein
LLVALVWTLESVVAPIMHDSRQEHLAFDFTLARPSISAGDAVAILQIPSISLNEMVIEGADSVSLRSGPGHRTGTPFPGDTGNSVIVGHASRFGGPFEQIGTLRVGDHIFTESRKGIVTDYVVKGIQRQVLNSDHSALQAATSRRLTLVTSDGGWGSRDRLVVVAEAGVDPAKVTAFVPPAPVSTGQSVDLYASSGPWLSAASAVGVLVVAVLMWLVLAGRARRAVLFVLVSPVVVLGVYLLWLNAERFVAITL